MNILEMINYWDFYLSLEQLTKKVTIQIADTDLSNLKNNKYLLCFAKKLDAYDYNVVWQAYVDYLSNNEFSWTPQYQLFCSNHFEDGDEVMVSTNTVSVALGEVSTLNTVGLLSSPITGGVPSALNLKNEYGPIYPGVKQLSTGIDWLQVSTPIYVSEYEMLQGSVGLTPVEKVLVWFEQNIETSVMFNSQRSNSIEIDLTSVNEATRRYEDGKWIIP